MSGREMSSFWSSGRAEDKDEEINTTPANPVRRPGKEEASSSETERVKHLELHLDSKDKQQLIAVLDLYISQQKLSAELSDKLEKTERKLVDTEYALLDLDQKYRQANDILKWREYDLLTIQHTGLPPDDRVPALTFALENAERKESQLNYAYEYKVKRENKNKDLVQNFRNHLSQQLDLLQRTVSASVMQQKNQLNEMKENVQSFISTKTEATEELRRRIGKFKDMCGSGIRTLDDLAGELVKNSQTKFEELNLQAMAHSSSLENSIAMDADQFLNELQSILSEHQNNLAAFAQQQSKGHLRAVETTRSISKVTTDFFCMLDTHASKLSMILEEAQTVQEKQLHELEKKFEECAANEERQLLEKVVEMLASSNAREKSLEFAAKQERQLLEKVAEILASSNASKKNLVQAAVDGLLEDAADRTSNLQKEISTAHQLTSFVKEQWNIYMEKTENNYCEDTAELKSGRCTLEEGFHQCIGNVGTCSQQWMNARTALLSLAEGNVASVDSIVRRGVVTNQQMREKLSSAASIALEEADVTNQDILSSTDSSLKLDFKAREYIDSLIAACHVDMR